MARGVGDLVGGKYRLAEEIGKGGMGRVWRARDEVLGRDVAVKEILFPDHLTPGERGTMVARAMREARAAAQVSHAGVITIHDVIEDGGTPWIVMEYIRGRSLGSVLKQQARLPWWQAAEIGAKVADALGCAHAAGVVHRDVKPDNILLAGDRVIVTDFGIARLADEVTRLTSTGVAVGTLRYMSPEQFDGREAAAPADMWALGVTLYEVTEGRVPFEGASLAALATAVLFGRPAPPANAGPLAPVIARALEKSPENRYPRCAEFAAALRATLTPAPPDPRPVPQAPTPMFPRLTPPLPAPAPPAPQPDLSLPRPAPTGSPRPRPGSALRGRAALTAGMVAAAVAALVLVFHSILSGGNPAGGVGAPQGSSPAQGSSPGHGSATAPSGAAASSAQPGATRTGPPPSHYAATLVGFTQAAKRSGTWTGKDMDGNTSTDTVTIGSAGFANDQVTFTFTAHHSGIASALSEETGGACVDVNASETQFGNANGLHFEEAPMAATPSTSQANQNDFSGSLTFAAFLPGTYTLNWGCIGELYEKDSMALGTLRGTSIGAPQVDNYGDAVWYITAVDYTSFSTTVRLTTISENGVLWGTSDHWYLSQDGLPTAKPVISGKSKTTKVTGQPDGDNSASEIVDLTVTFPSGKRGLDFYDDTSEYLNNYDPLP